MRSIAAKRSSGPVWLRGEYHGDTARLGYSTDGTTFTDTGLEVKLRFSQWKGARLALFSYGARGVADFDFLRFKHGNEAVPVKLTESELPPITGSDRKASSTNVRCNCSNTQLRMPSLARISFQA